MNKEEILQKAQGEGKNYPDEMEVQVYQGSNRVAVIVGMVMCLVLMFIKFYAGEPWQDLYCIWSIITGTSHFYRWNKLKQKSQLICGIMLYSTALMFLAAYLINIFK